jgi:hypothetical protein
VGTGYNLDLGLAKVFALTLIITFERAVVCKCRNPSVFDIFQGHTLSQNERVQITYK